MPEKVCSLFFLGTQHHRDNTKGRFNIINQFYKNTVEDNLSYKRLFDGPGGIGDTVISRKRHPVPGTYFVDFFSNTKQPYQSNKKNVLKQILRKLKFFSGSLFGKGVKNNIIESIQFIENIGINEGSLPDKINLYGFSRGGDTTIMLSNLLWKLYPEIEVNICIVDPVPGGTDVNRHESKIIPPNVKNMTVMLMQDENTPTFDPTDQEHMIFQSPTKTKVNFQIYRGTHGTGTIRTNNKSTEPTAILAHDTMYKFAKSNGTRLVNNSAPPCGYKLVGETDQIEFTEEPFEYPNGLTNKQRLIKYHQMKENFTIKFRSKSLLRRHLSTSILKEDYFKDPDFFINQEHRELFALEFPVVFNYYFKNNSDKHSMSQLVSELRKIQDEYPFVIFDALKRKGFTNNRIDLVSEPNGSAAPEKFPITNNLSIISSDLDYYKYAVKMLVNQLEVQKKHEYVLGTIGERLNISKLILATSKGLRKALKKVENSEAQDVEKIAILKNAMLNEYDKIKKLQKFGLFNMKEFSSFKQMKSILEAELLYRDIYKSLEELTSDKKPIYSILLSKNKISNIPVQDKV